MQEFHQNQIEYSSKKSIGPEALKNFERKHLVDNVEKKTKFLSFFRR